MANAESRAPRAPQITVEVAYARPDEQALVRCRVPMGTTARQAVDASGLLAQFADIDPETMDLGVFAQPVSHDYVVCDGERIEIYRPLTISPTEARRLRALAKRKRGESG